MFSFIMSIVPIEMWFIIADILIVVAWLMFNLSLEGRWDELPTLHHIANIGNAVIIITHLAIIIKYDLWC